MINTEVDVYEANGVIVKQIVVAEAGTEVFQHSHPYDHLSLLTNGAIEVWINGEHEYTAVAPWPLTIPANTQHRFVALEDMTMLYCVHNADRFKEAI